MLHRRTLLLSTLGMSFGAAFEIPVARAGMPYPQLVLPAIPLRALTSFYAVAGANAGSRVVVGGNEGVIIYSDDEGRSWHQAKVPVSATITGIAFATAQIGWAIGGLGVVLNTQDGGRSWTKQLDGIGEISLMNTATQAYLASQPTGSDQADHAIRRAQILTQRGPEKPLLSLLAINASEVFVFGAYRFADYSKDGGRTWTDWSLLIGDPVSHNIYGAAAIGGAYYLVAEAGVILRSTNGGQSFSQLAQLSDATFFGICDAGNGSILAYGVAGTMVLSTDAGASWRALNFSGTENINSVVRLGSELLLAGDGGGGLWLSRDHGASFTLLMRNPLLPVNALQPVGHQMRVLILSAIGVVPVDLSALG
jgi:photosystem II stability/assembly factor-like uncharacterized protein